MRLGQRKDAEDRWSEHVPVLVTPSEHAEIVAKAMRLGMTVTVFLRDRALESQT